MISAPRDVILYVVHAVKYSSEYTAPPKKNLHKGRIRYYIPVRPLVSRGHKYNYSETSI